MTIVRICRESFSFRTPLPLYGFRFFLLNYTLKSKFLIVNSQRLITFMFTKIIKKGYTFLYSFHYCQIIKFPFLLSSICIRRKYWIRENFLLPVFDGFTCFEMAWTWFDHFLKMPVCVFVCGLSVLYCGHRKWKTNRQKLMKLNIQLHFYEA